MNHKEQIEREIDYINTERLEHHILKKSYETLRDLNNFIYSCELPFGDDNDEDEVLIISVNNLINNLHENIRDIVNRINELEYHCECDECLIKAAPVSIPTDIKAASYEVKEEDIDRTIDPIEYMCMCGKCTEFISMNPCIIEERIRREQERIVRFAKEDSDSVGGNNARSNSL